MNIWEFFLWIFWVYILIACIWIFITIIVDVFRDPGLNGWGKALWVIFLVFLPFLAALIYLIARGKGMTQRNAPPGSGTERGGTATSAGGGVRDLADGRDRVGQEAARRRHDHPGRVRFAEGEGARSLRPDTSREPQAASGPAALGVSSDR